MPGELPEGEELRELCNDELSSVLGGELSDDSGENWSIVVWREGLVVQCGCRPPACGDVTYGSAETAAASVIVVCSCC